MITSCVHHPVIEDPLTRYQKTWQKNVKMRKREDNSSLLAELILNSTISDQQLYQFLFKQEIKADSEWFITSQKKLTLSTFYLTSSRKVRSVEEFYQKQKAIFSSLLNPQPKMNENSIANNNNREELNFSQNSIPKMSISELKIQAALLDPQLFEDVKDKIEKCEEEIQQLFWESFLKKHVVKSKEEAQQRLKNKIKKFKNKVNDFCVWPSSREGQISLGISYGPQEGDFRLFSFEKRETVFYAKIKALLQNPMKFLQDPSNSLFSYAIAEPDFLTLWTQNKTIRSNQEVEEALKNAPAYDFRIWPSQTKEGLFSYAIKLPSGLIDVRRIENPNKGFLPFIRAGSFIASYDEYLLSLKKAQSDQRGKKSNYDCQLILNLGAGNTAKGLTGKAKKNQLTCNTIDLRTQSDLSTNEVEFFKKLTGKSRLYIIGHSLTGSDVIRSDENVLKSAKEFADLIAKNAPQLIKFSGLQVLTISVIACYGGASSDSSSSFSQKLYEELTARKIPCKVLGRTNAVSRWDGREEGYHKKVNGEYQGTGNKRIFDLRNPTGRDFVYSNSNSNNNNVNRSVNVESLNFIDNQIAVKDTCINMGFFCESDAERFLKTLSEEIKNSKPIWLFWLVPHTEKVMLSFWSNNQAIHHEAISSANLEELFNQEMRKQIWNQYYPESVNEKFLLSNHAVFLNAQSLLLKGFRDQGYLQPFSTKTKIRSFSLRG